jgi:hypothetical protein
LNGEKKEFPLKDKIFRTGSIGYYAFGKIAIGGKRYQISCNVVEIGSKKITRVEENLKAMLMKEETVEEGYE